MSKLCKDCRWFVPTDECLCPENIIAAHSLVTGLTERKGRHWYLCSTQRGHWPIFDVIMFRSCGSRGRWFELREPGANP